MFIATVLNRKCFYIEIYTREKIKSNQIVILSIEGQFGALLLGGSEYRGQPADTTVWQSRSAMVMLMTLMVVVVVTTLAVFSCTSCWLVERQQSAKEEVLNNG